MKRHLVAALILLIGCAVGLAASYAWSGWYFPAVFGPMATWAYMWHLEEIKSSKWHFRLANRYFEGEPEKICKACPYWGLVIVSAIIFAFEVLGKAVAHVGYYPWVVAGWLIGYRPYYWSGLITKQRKAPDNRVFRGEWYSYEYHHGRTRKEFEYAWRVPSGLFVLMALCVIAIIDISLGHAIFHPIGRGIAWLGWVYIWPAIYASTIAAILTGHTWYYGVWPAARFAYRQACPSIKFVDVVPEPAKPSRPHNGHPPAHADS